MRCTARRWKWRRNVASGCFDALAADYDRAWTNSGPGRLQRDAVWRHIDPLFRPGDEVLDLGCGTGEDARHWMALGVNVRAMDASPGMVRVARGRGVNAQVGRIEDIGHVSGSFDGVLSNFGALNCVEDISMLRDPLARLVRPGGHLAICLMSRFCLWESAHYFMTGRFRKAARRWRGRSYSATLQLKVFYPAARSLRRALEPQFRLIHRAGIGLFVPPSYIEGQSLQVRSELDRRVAHWPVARALADHQLFIFIRQ